MKISYKNGGTISLNNLGSNLRNMLFFRSRDLRSANLAAHRAKCLNGRAVVVAPFPPEIRDSRSPTNSKEDKIVEFKLSQNHALVL